MLNLLRRAVKSWVVKGLLALLVLSFAVWGIGDMTTGSARSVATVGEREIDAGLFATLLRQQQQRFGLDTAQIRPLGLDGMVLGQMVREAALAETARRLGVSAPDSAVARSVRSDPTFMIGGRFDATQYAQTVTRVFPSTQAYEESVRRALAADQVMRAALGGVAVPPGAALALASFQEEQRRFDVLALGEPSEPLPEPDAATLAAHLDANADRFAMPETRRVVWLHLDPAERAEGIEIPEAELREAWEAQRAMTVMAESREVDQIVFDAEAEAAAARARIDAGEITFGDLLAERGLSREDASLGRVRQRDLRDERADAVFGLEEPGIAGPAATRNGFALLDVRDFRAQGTIPFEQLRETLQADLAQARVMPEIDRLAEEVEDLRAAGATLEDVAADLGLTLHVAEALVETGRQPAGLAGTPTFRREAFAAGIGEERPIQQAAAGGYFVLRVDAIVPQRTPELADVREAVAESWRREARAAALREEAAALRDRIAAGESLEALAEARGDRVTSVGPLRRDDPDPRLSPQARRRLFAAEPGTAAISADGARVGLVVLREIVPVAPSGELIDVYEQALAQSLLQDQIEMVGRALEAQAGVSINRATLDAVLAQIGG